MDKTKKTGGFIFLVAGPILVFNDKWQGKEEGITPTAHKKGFSAQLLQLRVRILNYREVLPIGSAKTVNRI